MPTNFCTRIGALVPPFGIRITVIVGGAVCAVGEAVESACRRADKALYNAKEEIRNRVQFVGN